MASIQPTQNILDTIISPKIVGDPSGYSIKTDIHNVDNIVIDGTIGGSSGVLKLSSTLDLNGHSLINIDNTHAVNIGNIEIKANEISSNLDNTIIINSILDLHGHKLVDNVTNTVTIGDSINNNTVVNGTLKTDFLTLVSADQTKTTFTAINNVVNLDGTFVANNVVVNLNLNAANINSSGVVSGVTGSFTHLNADDINITGSIQLGPKQYGSLVGDSGSKYAFVSNQLITDSSIVSLQTPTKHIPNGYLSINSISSNLITYTGTEPFDGQQILGIDGDIFIEGKWYAEPIGSGTGTMYLTDYPGGPPVNFANITTDSILNALITDFNTSPVNHTLVSSGADTITYTGDAISDGDLVKTINDSVALPDGLDTNTVYIAYNSTNGGSSKTIQLKTYPNIQALPNYNIEGPMVNALYTGTPGSYVYRDITDITTYTIQYTGPQIVDNTVVYVVQNGTTPYRASNSSYSTDHGSIVINPVYSELTSLSTYDENTPFYAPVPSAISGRTLVRILNSGQIVYSGSDFTQYNVIQLSGDNLPTDNNGDAIEFPGGLDTGLDYVIYSVGTTTFNNETVKIITLANQIDINISDFNRLPVLANVIVIEGSSTRSITDITSSTITYTGAQIAYGTELTFDHGNFSDFSDGLDGDLFLAVSVDFDYVPSTNTGKIQIRPLPEPVTIGYYGALEDVLQIQNPRAWKKLTYTLVPGHGFAIYTEDGTELPDTQIFWFVPKF